MRAKNFLSRTSTVFTLEDIQSFPFFLRKGDRVFLSGDLGAGKTTLTKHLISRFLGEETMVKSPTYVYYNRYGPHLYHFDLYRIEGDYETFVNIGGEEIFDDPDNICIVEWPEVLEAHYTPTVAIQLEKTEEENTRKAIITIF